MSHHLLTFLGTGQYTACRYQIGDFTCDTRYAPLAIAKGIAATETTGSALKVSVFCTPTALQHTSGFLEEWDLPELPVFPELPESGTEEDYWRIFQIIADATSREETLWLDITHSFRYLPLLAYSVLDHLQVVRGNPVGAIYYAAAEVLGKPDTWPDAIAERVVPVRDLTPFLSIQRWTSALRDFREKGDARELRTLADAQSLPLRKATRGRDPRANALQRLGKELEAWSEQVRNCRGPEIHDSSIGSRLEEFSALIDSDLAPALRPELDLLRQTFSSVTEPQLSNVFFAAEWAADKGLFQQAWTLLLEGLISFFSAQWQTQLEECFPDQTVLQRNWVAQLLAVTADGTPRSSWKPPLADTAKLAEELQAAIPAGVSQIYRNIAAARNDLNHAGMVANPAASSRLDRNLRSFLEDLRPLLPEAFPPA